MAGRRLKMKPRSDFIKRLAQAPTLNAIEELIWNAFDERAKTVEISLEVNELEAVNRIVIRDDGQSLPYENAAEAFENLGSSNKTCRTLEKGEHLHGRRGEGRNKALSLGHNVEWRFTYLKDGKRFTYKVIGTAGREDPFYLTDQHDAADDEQVGCIVTISDIEKSHHRLLHDGARQEWPRSSPLFCYSIQTDG